MQSLSTPEQAAAWLHSRVRGTLHSDSRQLLPGDGLLAWPGAATDARQYVAAALAGGAAACLVEQFGAADFGWADHPALASYAGLKAASGPIASRYFGQPSQQLEVLALTGTNGKTSSAWWLAQALSNCEHPAQMRCALIGTLGIGIEPTALVDSGLTSPDPVRLQRALRDFVDAGLKACAIEASSIGLAEHRLAGTRIRLALFTNLTQDHLDYHGSMARYWQAKRALFDWPGLSAAVVNLDDDYGRELAVYLSGIAATGAAPALWTVSLERPARLRGRLLPTPPGASGAVFEVCEDGQTLTLATHLLGRYNVSNLLGVIAALRALGVPLAVAVQTCRQLTPVPGRMEAIDRAGQPLLVVDYAHTPDALEQALRALQPLAQARAGRLWCVFGCGGERDAAKRPLMAAAAERHADLVVLTSDNPRHEKAQTILSQLLLGLSQPARAQVQVDRALAIAETVQQAAPGDVVLIAGKGHETTQDIDGIKRPFSDRAQALAALALRPAPATALTSTSDATGI